MKLSWKTTLVALALAAIVGATVGLVYATKGQEFDLPINATVTIKMANPAEDADVNDDGKVDGVDLSIVTRNLNTSPPGDNRADVDSNGVVNIRDLAYVARYFGQLTKEPAPTPTPTPAPSSVNLSAVKDNTLYEHSSGALSNGAGDHFFAGRTSSSALIRRGVIAFDISGNISSGSTINSVKLTLHMSRTGVGDETVELHKILADWGEGTSNASGNEGGGASATTGDATWNHTFFNTSTWTTAGGDFSATVSAGATVGGIGDYTWGSTAQVVADVQAWLDDPSTNFGWLLEGNEDARSAKRFDSKENGNAANVPVLTITFTP